MRSDKLIGTIRREGEKKAESGKALTAQSPSGSPMYRASPRQIVGGLIYRLGRFRFFEKKRLDFTLFSG